MVRSSGCAWPSAPARTPEWEVKTLRDSADVRRWLDELKKRVERWGEE